MLCYKDGGNQYYRIPGFPGNTYPTPASDATVYRFWSQYTSSTGGQEMPTGLNESAALPLEVTVESISNDSSRIQSDGVTQFREMNDAATGDLDESVQRDSIGNILPDEYKNGIEQIGTISCEEMDAEIGAVPNTQKVVGKNFCYSNHINGIRLENNFYKICTDVDGVYCTIDKWRNVVGTSEENTQNTHINSIDDISDSSALSENTNIEGTELVYVPVTETTYRLCYAISLESEPTYYVDCVSGDIVEMYVG